MKSPIKIVPVRPVVNVYWTPTDFCNFKCNYCPDTLHSGKFATGLQPGFPTDEEIRIFLQKLKEKTKDVNLNLQLGGGEPTLHPMFHEIVSTLSDGKNYIGVTTNGSRSPEWWEKVLPFLDNVTISLHPEFTKIEKINEVSRIILESGTNLMFNLSCDPNHWDDVIALYDGLDDELKNLVQPKVLNYLDSIEKSNYTYSKEQTDWIKKHIRSVKYVEKFTISKVIFDDGSEENLLLGRLTINNWNEFKGWNCKVASQSIAVNFNGEVYAGICRAKSLGRLTDFHLDENFIVCPFSNCACPNDLRSEKHKVI